MDPISLSEMDRVSLMDRMDIKFLFHAAYLPLIIEKVHKDYLVLDIRHSRLSPYKTLYFDTRTFEMYIKHHNRISNRYKIRVRKYVESDLCFFEIKRKNNKGRTQKIRIQIPEVSLKICGDAECFLESNSPYNPEQLDPVFWVNYSRITLVSKDFSERVTIDTGLSYISERKTINMEDLVIAEVKQEKISMRSPFAKMMQDLHLYRNSMSKYCLGIIQMFPSIKKNNFKPKLLKLNKILKHAT